MEIVICFSIDEFCCLVIDGCVHLYFVYTGQYFCPLYGTIGCPAFFRSPIASCHHARIHGPIYFPWVCRICPLTNSMSATYFVTTQEMLNHWIMFHPKATVEEVVHPDYGYHFSALPIPTSM